MIEEVHAWNLSGKGARLLAGYAGREFQRFIKAPIDNYIIFSRG
jgi:hypothetical protein